jgi:2-oxoisovalerate dehydrogenase E1 component alpha subunit
MSTPVETSPRRSRLHVPATPARPGNRSDFSYLRVSPAGALPKPPIDAKVADTEELSRGLVRVLDDAHRPVGPWLLQIDAAALKSGLRNMLLTRIFDQRMQRTHRQGRISFYIQSTGEEAVSVAQAMALRPNDMLFPSYRNQGLFVTRGVPVVDMMCQLLANRRDMCKGRQLPVMYHSAPKRLFSISGNLATQYPQAVGWAMAAAIKGETDIAASWLGEGASAEADFHHGLLFASVYRAPVILNVVNNQWAISTFQGYAGGEQQSFAARGPGFGIAGIRVDGNDFLAVYAVTDWAAQRARANYGPTLIELVTYRAEAHSTSDDPSRYRPRDDYQHWPLGDPIERLKQYLMLSGAWSEAEHAALTQQLEAQIEASWAEAMAQSEPAQPPLDRDLMFEDVFKEMPEHLKRQRAALAAERG